MDKAPARYSDEELKEFRVLVLRQREEAMREYEYLMNIVKNNGSNDTADTDLSFDIELDNVADHLSKQEAADKAHAKIKQIRALDAALVRIRDKTYGIDVRTGALIPKGRLLMVPWALTDVPKE
ncbi:MAG: TraR/DksA family transcriptional regulator [Bacteroidales bacterium]|nr:TraR/DksA family transcriptional regulator [Bacteroidales bacterium]